MEVKSQVKYLGIILDSRMSFRPHFEAVIPKAEGILRSLSRLLPNLHGPAEGKRRLYSSVIHSVLLYGAPVWWRTAVEDERVKKALRSLQRKVAIRVCCAYRTVSFHAAMMVAGIIPINHLAPWLAEVYASVRGAEGPVPPDTRAMLGALARQRAIAAWKAEELALLGGDVPGERVRAAVAPRLEEWVARPFDIRTTFRTTQLMTGHGCFPAFLYRINRAASSRCFHCDEEEEDDAEHTLIRCPAWNECRAELVDGIGGGPLTLPGIIEASLDVPGAWEAFQSFSGLVMTRKEEAERQRERGRNGRGVDGRVAPRRRPASPRPPRARLRGALAVRD